MCCSYGWELCEECPAAKELFDKASEILGEDRGKTNQLQSNPLQKQTKPFPKPFQRTYSKEKEKTKGRWE